jgi:hypothetical protein
MPNISLPLDDLHDSVERPVIFSIVRELLEITEVSDKTPISFYDDEGKSAQVGSLINADPDKRNKWPFDERVKIEVEEDFDPAYMYSIRTKQPEHIPIFKDDDIGAVVRPIYSPTKVVINFTYRARDKNQAIRWRNNIRGKAAMFRDVNLHEVSYHTHLQEEFIVIIKELHRLRENIAGYGETFDTYFAQHLSDKASIKTNLGGKAVLWGVDERQIRIQGLFDFEGAPEKGEKDGTNDAWSISFSYKFEYQKPILMNMVYPIVVHNQVLSSKYRPTEKAYSLEDQNRSFSLSNRAYNAFETGTRVLTYKGNDGISIPTFDEFSPKSILPSTVNVMTCLVVMDTAINGDPRKLMNLGDLGEVNLNATVLKFMKQIEYPFLGNDYHSIFSLSLYRHGTLIDTGSLHVDQNLDIYSNFDLNVRKTYRIRLGLVTDFTYLRKEALDRIRAFSLLNPGFGDILINCIDSSISKYASHPDIGKSAMSDVDRKLILASPYPAVDPRSNTTLPGYIPNLKAPGRSTPSGSIPSDYGRGLAMSTVQSMFVRAQRKES